MTEQTEQTNQIHRIGLADPKPFIEGLNSVHSLINEIVFKFTQEGVRVIAMDPANVAMVHLFFKKEGLTDYQCPTEAQYGVELGTLMTALKRTGDMVTLEFGNQIRIESKGKNNKKFDVPILDVEQKTDKVPPLEFKANFKMKVADFKDVIEDMAISGESCKFQTREGKLVVSAEGTKLSKIEVEVAAQGLVTEDADARYSIEYLQKMISKVSKDVTFFFGKDYPAKIAYEGENVELSIILAPRVDNN